MAVWQGDFGKGVSTGSGVWSNEGANPCILYGPAASATIPTGSGIPVPQFRLGMIVKGDLGAEFIYCKLTLAAVTDVLPGQAYQVDSDYNLTLLTTANSVLNEEVVLGQCFAPQAVVGVYYMWAQREGHAVSLAAAASLVTGTAETTTTGGTLKFLVTPTGGTKSALPMSTYLASSGITFTGNTVSGSPYITNLSSINNLQIGAVITGTNLPANAFVLAIDRPGSGGFRITIGTNTAGSYTVQQNATGTAVGTTFTVTNMVPVYLDGPTLSRQN